LNSTLQLYNKVNLILSELELWAFVISGAPVPH